MKKLIFISFISFLTLTACASAPDPISWKSDLENIKNEPINNSIDTKEIYYELNKKSVWK